MARRRRDYDRTQLDLLDIRDRLSTAPCVPAIREAVKAWRANDYPGVTDTTRELLNWWFRNDHRTPDGRRFRYYDAQREAMETLIYVYEVERVRRRKDLLERFAFQTRDLRLPPYDDFARYCIKMATGSGKTKVMALAVVWQYFNAVIEGHVDEYAKTFLLIAPNVIVLERLQKDFAGGRIFRTDPVFPKHFELAWDFDCYVRGDAERAHTEGVFFLTNVQQFYDRPDKSTSDEPEVLTALLGSKPPASKLETTDFAERIAKREGLVLVLNDEAHHTHDEDNEWNKVIRRLHAERPLAAQLDFSATPRYTGGNLFAWTVFDYPLKQAILDNIVKRPLKGISHIDEATSDLASVRYAGFLTAGVERWREYRDQLAPVGKKPVLFIMMNSNDDADDVGRWLRVKYPSDFGGEKTLVIHVDIRAGESHEGGGISKKHLDAARKLAREVDEDTSRVNAIASVLMLREGWDVQNVTVVVGLRPYTAKANILPEQTIGRGLRLMFRGGSAPDYQERVDIIGNNAFLEFVEELEKLEGMPFETFEVGKDRLQILTIMPVSEKAERDIGIPELTPSLVRKKSIAEEIAALDVMTWNTPRLPLREEEQNPQTFLYEGRDILTDKRLLTRRYEIPPARTPQEVIGYYARLIAGNIKLPSQFAVLAPKVREFFEHKAFGQSVNLDDPLVIRAMGTCVAAYVVTHEFERRLRDLIVEEKTPELLAPKRMLSSTPAFPHSRLFYDASKSVFNLVACSNQGELDFAKFLQSAEDVEAFAKLPMSFGFAIEYTDSRANLRHYYPDFVARMADGTHWVLETKGLEDVEVERKKEAAERWCENATALTGIQWRYLKVPEQTFKQLQPTTFEDLRVVLSVQG
jgi:type III restriction enzyme